MSAPTVVGAAFAAGAAAFVYLNFASPSDSAAEGVRAIPAARSACHSRARARSEPREPRRLVRIFAADPPIASVCATQSASAPKGRIQRTLTNGGLYPDPNNKRLQSRPSGSMAVFTEGGPALGGAESGASN